MGKLADETETTARVPLNELHQQSAEGRSPSAATLTCLSLPKLGLVYRLPQGKTVIGRAEDANLQLGMPGVSRYHAAIIEENGTYTLEDLGSTNGTYCRGQKLSQPLALRDRDTIRLGAGVLLKFAFHDELEEQTSTELYERATRDPLTSARNRRYFNDRLDSEWPWARRHERACALLMLDLDHFKRVNDRWGHLAGDQVLCELVRLVHEELRQEDLFGRVGGEEFAVLCRATGAAAAATVAERLRALVESHEFVWEGSRLPVTISIGIATSSEPGISSSQDLVQRADQRLYEAKRQGRNRLLGAESDTPSQAPK